MESLWTLAALITGAVIALPFALALEWLWLWGLLRVVGAALRAPPLGNSQAPSTSAELALGPPSRVTGRPLANPLAGGLARAVAGPPC